MGISAITLRQKCEEYTNFSQIYLGMQGIQIPYYWDGKNLPSEIATTINTWRGGSSKTAAQIQSYMNSNPDKCGVDCSGLAYYVLNEASNGSVRTYFEGVFGISLPYSSGIWSGNLTSTQYGTLIYRAADITAGCTIKFEGHVIVIYSLDKNSSGRVTKIYYAHSSGSMGPHNGYIIIGNEDQDLNGSSQTWYDNAYSDSYAKSLYLQTTKLFCLN